MGYETPFGPECGTCIKCKHYWQDIKACSIEPPTFIGPVADKVGRFCGHFVLPEDPSNYELFEGS
jgi:hypothetical protein